MRPTPHRFALALLLCGGCSTSLPGDGGAAGQDAATATADSAPPPAIDATAGPPDFGPPSGTIDPAGRGGTVNLLSFTAFGDVRPSVPDLDFLYPVDIITNVMKGMAKLNPEFAVGSGDYMFVEWIEASAQNQIQMLQGAEENLGKPIFHTLGNHECNSFTDVNCPMLNESVNIKTYMKDLMPWSPVPWYHFVVHTALGDAKFLFIAVNAWNDDQATWLKDAVAIPTRYTFVVRHHPTPDAGKPSMAEGIQASNDILDGHPVTLFLYGHVHEYLHLTPNAVIAGNAGAPLDMGHYGFLWVLQRPDGTIAVTEFDAMSGNPMDSWAVTDDGKATP